MRTAATERLPLLHPHIRSKPGGVESLPWLLLIKLDCAVELSVHEGPHSDAAFSVLAICLARKVPIWATAFRKSSLSTVLYRSNISRLECPVILIVTEPATPALRMYVLKQWGKS
jgi:hypothetical protein